MKIRFRTKILSVTFLAIFVGTLFLVWQKVRHENTLKHSYAAVMKNSLKDLKYWLSPSIVNTYFSLPNKSNSTLLIQSIVQNPDDASAHELIRLIIATKGVDLEKPEMIFKNNRYSEGRRPIHWAVERGNVEAVRQLSEAGVALDIPDSITGLKPLEFTQLEKDPQLREAWHLDEIEKILSEKLSR